MFRPIFIITSAYTAGVRRVLRQILQCLYSAYYVLLLLIMFVLLFSICGYFAFYENQRTDPRYITYISTYIIKLFFWCGFLFVFFFKIEKKNET